MTYAARTRLHARSLRSSRRTSPTTERNTHHHQNPQRGRSGRNFADEAAEASRTFQPGRTPSAAAAASRGHGNISPALRAGGTTPDGRGGGGIWGTGSCGVCGATNSLNTLPPSPSSRYASPRAGDNNNSSPTRAATRAVHNAWVSKPSCSSPLRTAGGMRQESTSREQLDGGSGGECGQCGCDAGGRMRVSTP